MLTPTPVTIPAIACPRTMGNVDAHHSLRTWRMSVWQIPADDSISIVRGVSYATSILIIEMFVKLSYGILD